MVGTTPIYGLPYQDGTDRACDAPDVWCEFASIVSGPIATAQKYFNRTADTRPMAKVSRSTPYLFNPAVSSADLVTWDVVEVDTDNMVDLDAGPAFVIPQRRGLYVVDVYVQFNTLTTVDNQIVLTLRGGSSPSFVYQREDRDLTHVPHYARLSAYVQFIPPANPIQLNLRYNGVPGPVMSFLPVTMAVYWVADL